MPAWLAGPIAPLAAVAAEAAPMYATATPGLRLAHRRTLAPWTAMDVAAAVAVGSLVDHRVACWWRRGACAACSTCPTSATCCTRRRGR